ncbi:MAG TPA: hypothetical protein PKD56_05530 [Chitinophagales bacterium]|nr:hypothetical protein [Chitinophagales bacterium]
MSTTPVAYTAKVNHSVLHKNIAQIPAAESLQHLPAQIASLNWLLGHLVFSRIEILRDFNTNTDHLLPNEQFTTYQTLYDRGTTAYDHPADNYIDFETLKAQFDATQPLYLGVIEQLSATDEATIKNLGRMNFYNFHESYHIGQMGIIRKLLGHQGAIK